MVKWSTLPKMERLPVLYEIRPVRISPLDLQHAPARRYRCLRCFLVFCAFLFFMLLLYIPAFHQTRTREDQAHAVSIAGWAHNRSRDLRLYVLPDNLTAIIPRPELCAVRLFLLVVVCSAVGNFEARAAIRETWASARTVANASAPVRVAFLLGDPDNSTLQELVEDESQRHGDVIQEGFIDSYNNLTLKTVMLLKWVRAHCTQVAFIMKTDDDMFVNVESLVRLLQAKGGPGLLLGALICGARPIADPNSKCCVPSYPQVIPGCQIQVHPDLPSPAQHLPVSAGHVSRTSSYSPRYMYAGRVYPNYVSGTGYVMAADVARNLYQTALRTPFFHLEDVYLTGICARRSGIRPRDHTGFTYGLRKMDPCLLRDRSVVTSHRVDMHELQKIWVQLRSPDLDCTAFAASQKPSSKPSGGKKVASVRRPGNRCV